MSEHQCFQLMSALHSRADDVNKQLNVDDHETTADCKVDLKIKKEKNLLLMLLPFLLPRRQNQNPAFLLKIFCGISAFNLHGRKGY